VHVPALATAKTGILIFAWRAASALTRHQRSRKSRGISIADIIAQRIAFVSKRRAALCVKYGDACVSSWRVRGKQRTAALARWRRQHSSVSSNMRPQHDVCAAVGIRYNVRHANGAINVSAARIVALRRVSNSVNLACAPYISGSSGAQPRIIFEAIAIL